MTGLRNVAERLAAGPASIAYLGNSVTVQKDGYRPHLHAGLIRRFGRAHRQINAGFGAVGSLGSVCTMDDLVIRHRPALCFVECMTGDMGVGLHADIGPALEGILKKLAMIDCSACFLNLPRRGADFCPDNPIVALYAQVAAYYGTASINLSSRLQHETEDFFRDAVHTTPAGGGRTAALILSELENLFRTSGRPEPERPLFSRDYSGAGVIPATPACLRLPVACQVGRFRAVYPFIEIDVENQIIFQSAEYELLGLLFITGPHSGPALIDGSVHQLRDRWDSYERLHAYLFQKGFAPNRSIVVAPMKVERGPGEPPHKLKIVGFLVRPAEGASFPGPPVRLREGAGDARAFR